MKIVVFGLTYPFRGGISHFTTALFHALSKRHDVQLISFYKLYPDFLFPGKNQLDVGEGAFKASTLAEISSMNPITWLKILPAIKRQKPDLILFMWWNPIMAFCYFFLARACRILTGGKTAFYCHNVFPHEESPLARMLARLAMNSPEVVMVQSTRDAEQVKKVFPHKKCIKAFHPMYDNFPKTGVNRADAREKLGLKSQRVLLFFGHIRKYKGLDGLLNAMPLVLKKTECTLVVAGEFYEPREPFDQIIARHGMEGRVRIDDAYIGNEKVELYFSAADAVVLPYVTASQSGVIALAYHFNVPAITTDVGGLKDVVDQGKTGYLVPPNDSEKLAEAILKFYQEKDGIDFESNIAALKAKYSWDALAREIEKCVDP